MKTSTLVLLSLVVIGLSACSKFGKESEQKVDQGHTVSWFLKHNEVLDQTLKLCSDDPAKYNKEPDCINALHAANQRSAGELHPIDWGKG
ncbi:hypothetical protein D5R81_15470 [Parashewanella spongiae]|uniref:EexN family lipoprotein n=1 Tax=Parashewanella spongiae TaxID=342950 RepID=A0A3A6THZ9_9GAMM|nr:EexN family lipoprotein [Parashewanella spongiae]MCL1079449.1 EexN family lipoprotein [Parashewanella spongiae]RJY07561.1 hypothetical protein D5R81_15470 [Parashewanella spongiae]